MEGRRYNNKPQTGSGDRPERGSRSHEPRRFNNYRQRSGGFNPKTFRGVTREAMMEKLNTIEKLLRTLTGTTEKTTANATKKPTVNVDKKPTANVDKKTTANVDKKPTADSR